MGIQNCRHCGKEAGEGEVYCPECRAAFGVRKTKRLWIFSIGFSILLLFLTGLLLWNGKADSWGHFWDSLLGRPAALVNNESISKVELQARLESHRAMLERRYGPDLFMNERGQAFLENLKAEVLEGMIEERLVFQEARKLGIQIGEERVEEELQQLAREVYGSSENFSQRLQEDGVKKEELKDRIRNFLMVNALKEAKTSEGVNSDVYFHAWLVQAKQDAKIAVYDPGNRMPPRSPLFGSCCGGGKTSGACGGRTPAGKPVDPNTEGAAKKAALEAFLKAHPSEKGLTAKVIDYGCHIQVDIQKEGRVVKSYTYQGGKVFENS